MKKILTALLCFCVGFVWSQNATGDIEKIPGPDFGDVKPYYTIKGDTVYGRHDDEFYSSYDAGLSWNSTQVKFNGLDITTSVIVGSTGKFFYLQPDSLNGNFIGNRLYVSSDEGLNWQLTSNNLLNLTRLKETFSGVLLATGYFVGLQKIYRSEDGGITWSPVFTITPNGSNHNLDIYPNKRVLLVDNGSNPTMISNDDGATWTQVSSDSYAHIWVNYAGTLIKTIFTPDYRALVLRSVNNGINWDTIPLFNTPALPWNTNRYFNSMVVLPSGKMLATVYNFDSLVVSNDDGLSWQAFKPTNFTYTFALNYPLPNGALLASGGYRSEDDGVNWTFSAYGVNYAIVYDVQPVNDSTLFASTAGGMWRTLDGENWDRIADRGLNFTAGHENSLAIITNSDSRLMYSNDLGSSFSDITPPSGFLGQYVGISPGDSLLFASTGDFLYTNLWRSADHGLTWELVADTMSITDIAYHPSGRYYALSNDFIKILLWYSDDFGRSWQKMPAATVDFPYANELFISPNGDIILAKSNFYETPYAIRSTDNGASWSFLTNLPIGDDSYLENLVENAQGHILAVTDTWLYRSIDGGFTWQKTPLPYQINPNNLSLSNGQYCYIPTYGDGIYRSSNPTTEGAYIRGSVLLDADADCSTDDGQPAELNQWSILAGGQSDYIATTDSFGRYNMFVDTGYYDVKVVTPQAYWWAFCDTIQTVYLPETMGTDTINFVATALSDCPLITVNVAAPMLRRCFDNQVYVQYCNQGTEPADSAWIDVSLDPYLIFIGSDQAHEDLGNNVLRFFLGDVDNGDCGQFQFTVNVDCNTAILGQTHCISAHGFPDTLCTTVPDWSGANLEATVSCQDTVVTFILENTGSAPSQTLDYIIIEDDVVMFQGSGQYDPNESMSIPVPANGHTYRLESEQEPGHPFSYRVIAFEEGCGGYESLGYINQFSVNGETPSVHQICVENTGSYDPNDKRGYPIGTGTEHLIRPGQPIEYMIRFQNTGTDTAFTVVVIDSLPQWLTTSLTPGAASHAYTWAISGPGIVRFTFNNILLPDSTTNLAGSQGFVTFNIDQQPDVPLGTQIRNDAAIFFDFNAPVITNETLHTVGVDLISSTVDIPNQAKPAAVTLSPNPASDHTTFQLRKGNFDEHRLQLFDPLGKPVFDTEVSGAQFVMSRRHLPAGAYGWRVTDHRGLLLESGVVVFE